MMLAIRTASGAATHFEKLVVPVIDAIIMKLTMALKPVIVDLTKRGRSCHNGGFRGIPGSVRHGGVRSCRCVCLRGIPCGIGFGGVLRAAECCFVVVVTACSDSPVSTREAA